VRIDAGPWREAQIRRADDTDHVLTLDGHTTPLALVRHDVEGTRIGVRSSADGTTIVLDERPRFPEAEVAAGTGGCEAPMPGKVVQVLVEVGQTVARGAPLVVLEAMKMEQSLTAPRGGQVSAVRCAAGERVDAGAVLVELVDAPT
jgi:biotin carboxyl carrier protein